MSDADIESLSIKDLKSLIAEAGLSVADCIDKSDLRARATEARAALAKKPAAAASSAATSTTQTQERKMGGYDCTISGPADVLSGEAAADLLVLTLHGLGANKADLATLPPVFCDVEPALKGKKLVFVFPQAPMTHVGAAWWKLDLMKFMALLMPGATEAQMAEMIRAQPDGLTECRERMKALLLEARTLAGGGATLPLSRVCFAGFSLGAITSLDLALQQPKGETPAGAIVMAGAPIVVEQWAASLALHPGLRVHLSHGYQDTTIPFKACGWVKQLLEQNGAKLTYLAHQGGHEVGSPEVVRSLARFVLASCS